MIVKPPFSRKYLLHLNIQVLFIYCSYDNLKSQKTVREENLTRAAIYFYMYAEDYLLFYNSGKQTK